MRGTGPSPGGYGAGGGGGGAGGDCGRRYADGGRGEGADDLPISNLSSLTLCASNASNGNIPATMMRKPTMRAVSEVQPRYAFARARAIACSPAASLPSCAEVSSVPDSSCGERRTRRTSGRRCSEVAAPIANNTVPTTRTNGSISFARRRSRPRSRDGPGRFCRGLVRHLAPRDSAACMQTCRNYSTILALKHHCGCPGSLLLLVA